MGTSSCFDKEAYYKYVRDLVDKYEKKEIMEIQIMGYGEWMEKQRELTHEDSI